MKVRDVMITKVKSVLPESSAKEAMDILVRDEISGLPVIDSDGRLMGMFTEKNILAHVLPSYLEQVGRFVYEEDPKTTKKKFRELANIKVAGLMRREVVTIKEDAALSEAARIMLTQRARRLPVVDNTGRVIGIVARCDILRALANG